MFRRAAALFAGLMLIVIAALTGCSSAPAVSYAPAAYGVQVGSVYDCYYVNSPAEVTTLIAQGHCPVGAMPTQMPSSWLDEYFAYYDSPVYYNTYVPLGYRTAYISTYHTYYVQHVTVINTASRSATWKGSNGKTVSGTQVNTSKMKFSTGSGSNSMMGGGSLRAGTGSAGPTGGGGSVTGTVKAKTGSGSTGGGSLRVSSRKK